MKTVGDVQRWLAGADRDRLAWIAVGLVLLVVTVSQALVLYPVSIQVGQGTIPWLMAHDKVLYRDIFEHRPPLTAWIVFAVQPLLNGDTIGTVRVLHLLASLVTIILVYVATRKLSGSTLAGVLAVVYFAALESVFDKVLFYFEAVQGLFFIAAIALLVREKINRPGLFVAGLLLGLAVLTKQQAILAAGFAVVWVGITRRSWRDAAVVGLGVALPVAVVLALYTTVWDDFYFWNVTFNIDYFDTGAASGWSGDLVRRMILSYGWLIPFGFVALRRSSAYWLVAGMGVAALTALYPHAGEEHAAAALPVVCVAFGVVLSLLVKPVAAWRTWSSQTAALAGVVAMVLLAISTNVLTSYVPTEAGFRAILGRDMFGPVVGWLGDHAAPGDTLFVIPSTDTNSQLHPLTGMAPPGTWVTGNKFGLAPPFVVARLLDEWEHTPPTWVVLFPDMLAQSIPAQAQPMIDFVMTQYDVEQRFGPLPFYGAVEILHLKPAS